MSGERLASGPAGGWLVGWSVGRTGWAMKINMVKLFDCPAALDCVGYLYLIC